MRTHYMATGSGFADAVALVLDIEGLEKVTDDPKDPGGLTKWGFALKWNPDLTRETLLAMDRATAIQRYRRMFWDFCRCGEMPWGVALVVFDCAVNQGPTMDGAGEYLQRSLGALGYPVKVDGVIGPKTIAVVDRLAELSLVPELLEELLSFRAFAYATQGDVGRFGRGLLRRTYRIHRHALRV